MGRPEINRSGEMEVFVQVVEQGGFSAAARRRDMTPSAVSKLITRLEQRLGTRLINRSTRQLQLTPEGSTFYERAARVLADIAEAERIAAAGERASGPVRINTSASYSTHVLMPLLPDFLSRYPDVTLSITQTDAVVDLVSERVDVAVRAGPLKNSSLIARSLGSTDLVIVAAPAYLARHGTPRSITELERHNRLGFDYTRASNGWPLCDGDREIRLPTQGNVRSDGEGLRQLALAGVGLVRLGTFTVRADIAAGRLLPVMEEHNPREREDFHAVYLGQGGPLPARVRVLLDYLAQQGRVG